MTVLQVAVPLGPGSPSIEGFAWGGYPRLSIGSLISATINYKHIQPQSAHEWLGRKHSLKCFHR